LRAAALGLVHEPKLVSVRSHVVLSGVTADSVLSESELRQGQSIKAITSLVLEELDLIRVRAF